MGLNLSSILKKRGPLSQYTKSQALDIKERGRALELRLIETYGLDISRYGNSRMERIAYASSILYLDLMKKCFAEVDLPKNPEVLEIGVDNWLYVQALYKFIQVHSQSESVHIHGIEYYDNPTNSRVKNRISGLEGVTFSHIDFFDLPADAEYDMVIANHPLATPEVYAHWGIPYRPMKEFWERAMGMLKPGGILFGTGYTFNEGASAFNVFPEEERILKTRYTSLIRTMNGMDISSIKGFNENVIMMARKAA